jgi:SAM-dependent methyltransferase
MSLFVKLRDFLTDPRLEGVDVDSDELLQVHRKILMEKRMMEEVFSEFYSACIDLDTKYFQGEGDRVEIGAGVSFFKEKYPEIIATDIKEAENLDRVIDALDMDFDDASVRGIYGINCFHHFPDPEKYFAELDRVLVPGGGCVLIEPYHGPLASYFYKKLFNTETFDKQQKEWTDPENMVMSGANQALSYIVFKRDVEKFQRQFPQLEICYQKPLNNYVRYLLSGGLNFRSLLPGWSSPLLKGLEFVLRPVNRLIALHHIVVIKKKA